MKHINMFKSPLYPIVIITALLIPAYPVESIPEINPYNTADIRAKYYVAAKYSIDEEKNILTEITGLAIKDVYIDSSTGIRKYLLSNNIVANTDGYGTIWFTGYKKYNEYRNVSKNAIDEVLSRIRTVLKNRYGREFDVDVVSITGIGKRVEIGTKYYKKNGTVIGVPYEKKTIYSVKIDLLFTINNIPLKPDPYLVIDYMGEIIGGGIAIPKIVDHGESRIPTRTEASTRIIDYLRNKYGSGRIAEISNISYMIISPLLQGSSEACIAPGYYGVAIYDKGMTHIYYVVIGDEEKIYVGTANTAWYPPEGILSNNVETSRDIDYLGITTYILTLIVGVLTLLYMWKTRNIQK